MQKRANAPDNYNGQPFVLIEKVKGANVIAALNRMACTLGLSVGMKLADARALVPDLLAYDHDPLADAKLLDRLALRCERYTPMVAVREPQALILDMTGCLHLYAGEDDIARRVENDLAKMGFSLRHSFAATGDAAIALAAHGLKDGAQMQLPVSVLAMNDRKTHDRKIQALERAGLYQIGDLESRPRGPLAARFGNELVLRLERILGRESGPVDPLQRRENIRAERRFAEPLGHLDSAVAVLADLFGEAVSALEERHEGARFIIMRLFRCDGYIASLEIETGAPTRDMALFKRLLTERIDKLNDPLDPGFGYDLVRLTIAKAQELHPTQITLEGERDVKSDEAVLVGQLSIRLGRKNLHRFTPADSHIPEHGLSSRPAIEPPLPFTWDKIKPDEPPQRPLFLFNPPQRLQVMAEVPDGPPRRFSWNRKTYLVTRAEGPERIASEWWRRRAGYLSGKGGLTRDYYRVEDSDGRRYWLFRRGLFGDESGSPEWYMHGTFA